MKFRKILFHVLAIIVELIVLSLLSFSKNNNLYAFCAPIEWLHYNSASTSLLESFTIIPAPFIINLALLFAINERIYRWRKGRSTSLPQSMLAHAK